MSPSDCSSRILPLSTSVGGLLAGLALLVMFFGRLAERPLKHTDLWGHLVYGRYYDQHREFPATEPFLTHSVDDPYIPTCWLAQWGGYRIRHAGGTVALQLAYAVMITGFAGCFLWTSQRLCRSWSLAVLFTVWFLWLEYQQIKVVRPQHAGMLCYAIVLGLLYGRRRITVPRLVALLLVMVLWTNLHGSFAIAPVILLIAACGRVLDLLWKQRKAGLSMRDALPRALRERTVVRTTLIALALIAFAFVNPFGWKLWGEVITFSKSPNLRDLIEWKHLWKTPKQGTVVLYSLGITILTLAAIRLRPRWERWLPVLVLGGMMVHTARYIVWWAPLFVLAVLPYWNVWRLRGVCASLFRRAFSWLEFRIAGGRLILLAAFGFVLWHTPWGNACFRGGPWSPRASYVSRTPLDVTQALRDMHPEGLICNTMEWGDWMIWSSHNSLSIFIYTHAPEIPPNVWQDYISFVRQYPGWKDRWDKYEFSYAVVEYRRHDELAESLKDDPDWKEVYRDRRAVIFERRE